MDFAQPYWLFIGFLACFGCILVLTLMQKKRQAALEKFAARQLIGRLTANISSRKRRSKNVLLLLAIFFCFIALARPQYGVQWVDVKRKGIDLLFAIDTSKSMLAEDIKPNRLKRAHLAILDFVQQLDGDRVGLIPFAGSAFLMCPLTLDYEAFADSLAAVTTDIIPRGGTNLAAVIDMAVATLNNAANHKILILVTDGENLEGDAVKAAENAAKAGLTIYTVGVGTSQGELIPVAAESGKGFIKNQDGTFVTSRLDETTLKMVAEKSGGLYVPLGTAGEGLETIYQQKLALIPKDELAERRHKVPVERFEWPLAAVLFLLIVELLIGERKNGRRAHPLSLFKKIQHLFGHSLGNWFKRRKKIGAAAAIIVLLGASLAPSAYCSKGEEAYNRQDYLQAAEYYRQKLEKLPEDPQLLYNYGTAAFKNNMYDEAIEAFTKALKSDDIELQKKAYYNRGNSYYQKGVEAQQADPKVTIDQWQQALSSLDSALQLNPQDADAEHNRQIIAKQLEELKKQQQQKQQDNKDKQENEAQQKQKDQQQSEGSEQKKDDSAQQEKKQPGAEQQQAQDKKDNKEQQQEESSASADEKRQDSQPEPINPSPENKDNKAEQSTSRKKQQPTGKMTKEEAVSLLNALKNEEGELNFVPSSSPNTDNDVKNDW